MKIFREETFGGVLYDTRTLRFELVDSVVEADKVIPLLPKVTRTDIPSSPVRAYFEVTQKCNLACKHCFVSSGKKKPHGLDTEGIEGVLRQLSDNQVLDVRFTGGEVTQRPDYKEILQSAKNKGFSISLNTNGVFDDPDDVIQTLKLLDLEQVTVSIDGMEKNHDFMRGKGTFHRTLKAIRSMYEQGIHTRINTVITKKNVNETAQLLELASTCAEEINFFCMRPVGRAVKQHQHNLDFQEFFPTVVFHI